MTILLIPNLLADGNGNRESYSATIEQPSHLKGQSISHDPRGFYSIDSGTTVLFMRIGGPLTIFHAKDTGTSAHIRFEMLEGKKNHKREDLAPGDNYIEPLGVFHRSQGNKEIE